MADKIDHEANDLAWRAFYLGVRVAMQCHCISPAVGQENAHLEALYRLAQGNCTVIDPTEKAVKYPSMSQEFIDLGNDLIRHDRGLAGQIWTGYDRATQQGFDS